VKVEHEGETSLLFYKPSGQISHYKNGNTVVIFKWQNVPKNAEITGLIIVKLGSEFFPNTVYEFNF
jgi:hypothetical protein